MPLRRPDCLITCMGEHFRLEQATIAIVFADGKEVATHIPAGTEIVAMERVEAAPDDLPNRRVSVQWDGKPIWMFAVDIQQRSERLTLSAVRKTEERRHAGNSTANTVREIVKSR